VAVFHPGLPGYKISVFTRFAYGGSKFINPDSIAIDGSKVFIGFQNVTAKDCTDGPKTSTIVQYTMAGTFVKKFTIPGHNDGLRVDPTTHLVWATSCEDGNPQLNVIDPTSGTVTPYTLPAAPHGGGYDDLWAMNGKMFIAASNPTLDANGNNVFPAIDSVALSGSNAVLTPVLMANATATDTISGTSTTLNLTDPDSFSVDNKGQLVLVSQGDSRLVFIANPGTPQQTVTTTPVGNQLDDTVWSTALHGRLLVTDGSSNAIYWVHVDSNAGTVYTEAPDDSGVVGFLGTVDLTTGFVKPVMIGFSKATGLAYVPDPAH
jgi:DNA-binding beta-propeller fold protein YncE